MTPEKTHQLYHAFPWLYRGKDKPISVSLMSFGFACEDGWFNLIWQLSTRLEEIARHEGRLPDTDDWPEALQVKEKFGRLRFHIQFGSPDMRDAIDQASSLSEKLCELCGDLNAHLVGNQTVCDRHGGALPGAGRHV